jgi:hypothetical protein
MLDAGHLAAFHSAALEAKSFWVVRALLDQQEQRQKQQVRVQVQN